MAYITIPSNQFITERGQMVKVIINKSIEIGIPCTEDRSSTASYDTGFYSDEFNPAIHSFTGITGGLTALCKTLK